jgi:hypothetical protein
MRVFLKSQNNFLICGNIDRSSYLSKVDHVSELFYNGTIQFAHKKGERYEVGGLSPKGRPIANDPGCVNCPCKWTNCDGCYKADRDQRWHILPDGAKVIAACGKEIRN